MDKIGIKILSNLSYEQFERFEYLVDYDFEYDDMMESIEEQKVIAFDIEEDEDREEDLEALKELLEELDREEIKYKLYAFCEKWELKNLNQIV